MLGITLMEDRAQQRNYTSGSRIFPQPDTREMYLVISGTVNCYQPNELRRLSLLNTFTTCDTFGMHGFFTGADPYIYQAATDCVVFVISQHNFYKICQSLPSFIFSLLQNAYGNNAAGTPPVAQEAPAREPANPALSIFPSWHKGYPGIVHPEHNKFLYATEYTCPHCGKTFLGPHVFHSKLIPSRNMRYDLRTFYHEFQMEWHDIITCPKCYFSTITEYFNQDKALKKAAVTAELEKAHNLITLNLESEPDLDLVFAKHYLALICARGYVNHMNISMRLWSHLSWLYEDVQDAVMMKYAAMKAVDIGEILYTETMLTKEQEQMICLVISGMLYRAGATKGMRKWLFQAKSIKKGKRLYLQLAEELMEYVRMQPDVESLSM